MTDKAYASLQMGKAVSGRQLHLSSALILIHFSFFSPMLKMKGILSDYQSTVVTQLQFCMCFLCTVYESQFTADDKTKSLVIRSGNIVTRQTLNTQALTAWLQLEVSIMEKIVLEEYTSALIILETGISRNNIE